MRILGIGTDIEKVERFTAHAAALPKGAAQRYLTPDEMAEAQGKGAGCAEYLASRFTAKEAVMKSLGAGMDKMPFKDIGIATGEAGRPITRLYCKALKRANEIGASAVMISISHGKEYAVAFAMAVAEDAD